MTKLCGVCLCVHTSDFFTKKQDNPSWGAYMCNPLTELHSKDEYNDRISNLVQEDGWEWDIRQVG